MKGRRTHEEERQSNPIQRVLPPSSLLKINAEGNQTNRERVTHTKTHNTHATPRHTDEQRDMHAKGLRGNRILVRRGVPGELRKHTFGAPTSTPDGHNRGKEEVCFLFRFLLLHRLLAYVHVCVQTTTRCASSNGQGQDEDDRCGVRDWLGERCHHNTRASVLRSRSVYSATAGIRPLCQRPQQSHVRRSVQAQRVHLQRVCVACAFQHVFVRGTVCCSVSKACVHVAFAESFCDPACACIVCDVVRNVPCRLTSVGGWLTTTWTNSTTASMSAMSSHRREIASATRAAAAHTRCHRFAPQQALRVATSHGRRQDKTI